MGATLDEVLLIAENALSGYLVEMEKSGAETASPSLAEEMEFPAGSVCVLIPLVRFS